jgi:internalin A
MILKRVRVLLEIGDTMRLLCCLLMLWSALLSDAEAQTTKASQEAAVAAIKKLGGRVTFDEQDPGKPVVHVSLFGQDVTDASLEHLKEMTSLTSLDLVNTRVTEAGLEHLKGLTNLQELCLPDSTRVTDAGLVHFNGLTSLQTLVLFNTDVTAAGLEHLKD